MCCDFHVYIESIGVQKKCAAADDMNHPFQFKQQASHLSLMFSLVLMTIL